MKKKIGYLAVFLSLPFVFFLAWVQWISQGEVQPGYYQNSFFWDNQEIEKGRTLKKGEQFNVMSWNIAFGHGEGSEGEGYTPKPYKEYVHRLAGFSALLSREKVNIAFLQEVDFKSERTFYLNEAQFLAKNAYFSEIAPVTSWKLRHLPFPGMPWEFQRHFGEIESGGSILSQYRLKKHSYYILPKPSSYSWVYRKFYLSRYIQMVKIKINDTWETLINVHLEAFDMKNRQEHLEKLVEVVKRKKPLLIVGDFNMFEGEKTGGFEFIRQKIPENYGEALAENLVYLGTFPSHKPDRRLDYIFYDRRKLTLQEAKVVLDKNKLSDHLPIKARFLVHF